jgi:hypothetical protein
MLDQVIGVEIVSCRSGIVCPLPASAADAEGDPVDNMFHFLNVGSVQVR